MEGIFWSDKRVLVTGATGFVGSWLVDELLDSGAYVAALVRDPDPQSEFYTSGTYMRTSIVSGRIEDFWSLERAINEHEIDTVFHLAAQPLVQVAYRSPLQTFEANIRGTYNLLEACRFHRSSINRVIIASSDKAYGEHETLPYTEDMRLQGRYPYEVSKSCGDLIAQSYFHTYDLPIAIARCGNIYGGGDLNWSRIVPGTIRSLLREETIRIRSDGAHLRDYIYVRDVIDAYLRLAQSMDDSQINGQAFNFSPGSAVSVLELVKKIQALVHIEDANIEILNTATGEIPSQYLSSSKAKQYLSWHPKFTLDQGLTETVDWYRDFLSAPVGSTPVGSK